MDTLEFCQDDDVLRISLNRQGSLNALNLQMMTELIDIAEDLRDRDDVQFVVLEANGRVFSAGADLSELESALNDPPNKNAFRTMQYNGQKLVRALDHIEQTVVTRLDRSAYGAGLAVALAGDFIVMAEDAVANLPESRIGMFLTYGLTPRLVSLIGPMRAKRMITLAEDISAATCLDWGLVHSVVPAAEIDAEVNALLTTLRQSDADARRIIKKAVRSTMNSFGDVVALEDEIADAAFKHGGAKDAVNDFVNRTR